MTRISSKRLFGFHRGDKPRKAALRHRLRRIEMQSMLPNTGSTLRRWCSELRALAGATSGTSAVEFALAAPLLLGLLTPVADLGLAYSQQIQVQQAAQAGAQYASLHAWNSNSVTAIENAVTSSTRLTLLPVDPLTNPAPSQTCGCPDGSKIGAATCHSLCIDGEYAGYYVNVNAQAAYSPVLPYSLLGTSTILRARATVRVG